MEKIEVSWPLPARQNLQAFQRLKTLINLLCLFKYKNILGIFSVPGGKKEETRVCNLCSEAAYLNK